MTAKKKVPIAILIGGGSKLPAILRAERLPESKFYISLVATHKKVSKGIEIAVKNKIPAAYFNLIDFKKRFSNEIAARKSFMKFLGWFISQPQYKPKILVLAGWDLILDKNFLDYFKSDFGEGYSAINLHPALLPTKNEKTKIKLPDGTFSPIIKGEQEQVLKRVLSKKLTYFGPTVHFVSEKYDTGIVIKREFIKVEKSKTIEDLRKKLMPLEDRILVYSINQIIEKYL